MVIGLLVLVLLVALVVLAVRKVGVPDGSSQGAEGRALRRGFQYLVLLGLLLVVGTGLAGLLGRLLTTDVLAAGDEAALARDLTFTVVGGPLYAGLALWSRRRLAEDAEEAESLGWAGYVTAAALTTLLLAMTGLARVLEWVTGLEPYDGFGLAQLLVWGGLWGAHWWVDARVTPRPNTGVHHLGGSLVGLVMAAVGLGGLLAGTLRVLLGLQGDTVVGGGGTSMLQGLVTLAVGAPVWLVYWAITAVRDERTPLWHAYVLLVGVGGGLVTAVVAASLLVYDVLVWLVGDPATTDAAQHFDGVPSAAGAVVVGVLVWWYHQAVLRDRAPETRTEVQRVYEYLMAGTGLLAAAGGLVTVLAALVEAVSGTALVGGDAVNTLLAAFTLLAVGGPVWWFYWRRIQAAALADPEGESLSPTRRVYLALLFGVGGVAAVVALIVGVYLLLEDVVEGTVSVETLRRVRFPVGVLLTTAAVAAYHWRVHQADRARLPAGPEAVGPRFVLLVGPGDRSVAGAVARRTHGQVLAWSRLDDGARPWSADEVMTAIAGAPADEVMVLADETGLRAIPIRRG
jgi:hypothetical protein